MTASWRVDEGPERPEARAGIPNGQGDAGGPDALQRLWDQLAAVPLLAGDLLETRLDAVRLRLRQLAIGLGAAVLLGAAAAAVVATAAVLLVIGAAQGVSELAGGRVWVGNVAVGATLLFLAGTLYAVLAIGWGTVSRRATIRKYEARRQQRRERQDSGGAATTHTAPAD